MTDFGLAKKSVIITGGAGGLGRAFAQGFLDAGAYVAIADVNEAGAQSVANAFGAKDKQCIGCAVDVTDETSIARMAERAREAFGGVDILINNAAIYGALTRKPFFEITAEEWDRVLSVNLKGAFLCAKAVYPHMKSRGGKIVNIASASAMSGSPLWLLRVVKGRLDRDDSRPGSRARRSRCDGQRGCPGIHADRREPQGGRQCRDVER